MNIFSVLTMIGGLAMFLYGMDAMGDGLAKLSGGKLEQILEKLTSKRIMAVLLGVAVTAVIQSSSATTVMVVGFVNSCISVSWRCRLIYASISSSASLLHTHSRATRKYS